MKKQKHKKKLNKPRTAQLDATAKFMEESRKEAAAEGLHPLDLVPQEPLGIEAHRE